MLRMIVCLFFFVSVIAEDAGNTIYYDTFTGEPITLEEYQQHVKDNTTFWCTGKRLPCDPNGRRTTDGSCNNLQYPNRGTSRTPYITELPLVFAEDNEPVPLTTGEKLDSRRVRLDTLPEGDVPDSRFSILTVHFLLFGFGNIGSVHDTVNYILWKPYCCKPEGKKDKQCYPTKIADDDIVHQYSDIRCFNMTRPITYQSVGCLRDQTSTPARLNSAKNYFDLSALYAASPLTRTYKDGLLKVEKINGKIFPISRPPNEICLLNAPGETYCQGVSPLNSLFGLNFLSMILWRYHNYLVRRLKQVNPHWDDEKLFQIGRDINIAQFAQIYYYELLPKLIGRHNLLREGVISASNGFRDLYDDSIPPQMSLEYTFVLRWVHTVQPGNINKYDSSGNYLTKIKVTNTTFRTGMFPVDGNMEGFTQGTFRQPAGGFDHITDSILGQNAIPGLQRSFDLTAADLVKEGLFGIQPYVAYKQLCTGRTYRTFEDLADDFEPQHIETLKASFKYVQDVPLIVALWLEKHVLGGHVPRTFACLNIMQLKRFIAYDRHWYERPNRPNAFTSYQLAQIRKSSAARIFCDVGDTITEITPHAFLRPGRFNRITNCNNIQSLNFEAWRDFPTSNTLRQ